MTTTLKVSEVFHTLQGEGASAGQPSSFLRLAGCNLHCTWCDTKYTWDWERYDYAQHVQVRAVEALASELSQRPRLVITGGEPLLQQAGLEALLELLPPSLPIEVETNGTRMPSAALLARVSQWNVAPKLDNSGEPRERRWDPEVVTAFRDTGRAFLKWVVRSESDAAESAALMAEVGWPRERAFFMPEATSRWGLVAALPDVASWALSAGVGVSSRLHLLVWDGERGR